MLEYERDGSIIPPFAITDRELSVLLKKREANPNPIYISNEEVMKRLAQWE
ncbi:hypothetical protein BN938_2239 [Mucinivorans hirudinis]|uniref:Uncharacterized protein n=1 Tax=Mucinivorans hirudinis TaxID=1433126 RepID=A0A060R9L1_9BACT|nr:hypothetical protein BN938_2239 [Mucinivorans hirudinis]